MSLAGKWFLEDMQVREEKILRAGKLGGANPSWWFKPVRRKKRAKEKIKVTGIINLDNKESNNKLKIDKVIEIF